MDKVAHEILTKISRIYDGYEENANEKSQEKRMQKGAQIDRREREFMDKTTKVSESLYNVLQEMEKSKDVKSNNELRDCPKYARDCLGDIQNIIKKKSLMFKVDDNLTRLADSTAEHIEYIRKDLAHAGESKFLCCGTDGTKKFKKTIELFKNCAVQWKMLARLEPKDSVENFISPKFSSSEYEFVRQILRKNWPKEVEKERIVEKQVVKYIKTEGGKPSRLVEANEYMYGINRQENPSYGLKIYHEEADSSDDPVACSFLGRVYEQGILLPKDLNKSVRYYQKAMKGSDSYANYRFAMALIRGELNKSGVNRDDIQKGLKLLEQAATCDKPSAEAMVQLGEFYERGCFAADRSKVYEQSVDLKKAIAMYRKAKELHLPRASNNLGVLYINNKNMSESNPNSKVDNPDVAYENLLKGKKYLVEAQLQGFPQAFYNLGCLYESGSTGKKDTEQALLCFYNGGLKGDNLSRLKFAYQLINQTSIMKEEYEDHYRIAYRWLENMVHKINLTEESSTYSTSSLTYSPYASEEKAEALFYLGLMHEYGFGVDKSPKKAFSYFLQSADLRYPAAKNKLGDCYFSGYGTREDRKLAMGCYLEAADDGSSQAMTNLGTIYLNGIPEMVERNSNKASEYFIKAMNMENVNAMIHLSYMYRVGLGFDPNPKMAKQLLEEAAKNRSPTALYMLKEMGGEFDQRILFNNLDNQFFLAPKKINLKEIVPVISNIKKI